MSTMDAHLRFFERGAELMQGLQPYLQHASDIVESLKAEAGSREAVVEATIAQHQRAEAAREID